MLKNYIYLNILFIFGLFIYLLAQNLDLELRSVFYLFFSIFSILIPLGFLVTQYNYQDEAEEKAYKFLFSGFLIYGLGNLMWYINEIFVLDIPVFYLNLFFLYQIISKNIFFKHLISSQKDSNLNQTFKLFFNFNLLMLLLTIFYSEVFESRGYLFELYFIFESFVSILFIFYYLNLMYFSHLDFRYFGYGNIIWLLGDILFYFETVSSSIIMGNLSDFSYFIGFYLMLSSIIFKNFSFWEKVNQTFDLKISFS